MAERYPQHVLHPGKVALYDEWVRVLRPEFAVLAEATAAQDHGARVVTGCRITHLDAGADSVTIYSDERTWILEQDVITAGPWTNRFAPQFAAYVSDEREIVRPYSEASP